MRVAMLHWAFPPIIGGVETHLVMLGPGLIQRGCEVYLLTGSLKKPESYVWRGMQITRSPFMDLNSLSPELIAYHSSNIQRELKTFIQKVSPDLIHAHNMHYFSPVHAEALADISRKMAVPLILTAHNVWEDALWEQMLEYRNVWDGIISVSHFIAREMIRSGYPAERVTVIHHGIDLDKFSSADEHKCPGLYAQLQGRRVIFHPARMSLAKGSDVVVKALARIKPKHPDVMLVLAGTEKTVDWGSYQEREIAQIRQMIEDFDLKDHVFIKFFAWDEIPAMYRMADIVVYPSSFEEPFGLVMLEAMATGKPIIVTDAGGMPEVVKDGFNGFVIPKRDPETLAEKCDVLLSSPSLAANMGRNGRQLAEDRFAEEIMITHTLDFYRRIIEEGGAKINAASNG
ncbi:MAG: glycosyltransferase family 4 protein [Peptococcaceae bacterium]|nr:glycosyltransferase family 4 protein [Peptococcaceae bacterium]